MAEDFQDPRDVPWHPRRATMLLGHGQAEARLLRAWDAGKLHHAWLISGARGIGKATLAYRFARFLAQPDAPMGARSLHVEAESATFKTLSAGAHPNIQVLERAFDKKLKRLKTEIAVDDSREAIDFAHRTSASGGWRIIIVDAADDLNMASANALLKLIEEPPQKSIILLICHQPGRLLRTIRSRCIHLGLQTLDTETTLRVLRGLPKEAVAADDAALRQAAELSRGSPGHAMDLAGSKGAATFAEFLKKPKLTSGTLAEFGASFAGREAAEDYAIFCELLVAWIARKARDEGLIGRGAALALAHDEINASLRQTDALNLDRRQTVTDALMRLDEALKVS